MILPPTTKSNEIASGAVSSYTYAVNQLGQRSQVSQAGSAFATAQSIEWGYDSIDGQALSYDPDGNLLSDGQRTYTLDGDRCEQASIGDRSEATCPQGQKRRNAFFDQNRLISTTETSNSATAQYQYDYLSRRVKKTEGSDTTAYLYEGWNPELQTKNGIEQTRYSWGVNLSGSIQGAGGVGGQLSVRKSTGLSGYPTYDGNVSEYLDITGATIAHYEYDAFGKTTVKTGTQADNFEHRFSAKPIENESGLYYYGYRYYDPQTGRWPSRDPIGEDGGHNLYGFVGNSPIGWVDILGKTKCNKSNEDKRAFSSSLTVVQTRKPGRGALMTTRALSKAYFAWRCEACKCIKNKYKWVLVSKGKETSGGAVSSMMRAGGGHVPLTVNEVVADAAKKRMKRKQECLGGG